MPSAAQAVASRTVVVGYDGSQAARLALRRVEEETGLVGEVVVVTEATPPDSHEWETETEIPLEDTLRLLAEAAPLPSSTDRCFHANRENRGRGTRGGGALGRRRADRD
jgi:hypothetical protein